MLLLFSIFLLKETLWGRLGSEKLTGPELPSGCYSWARVSLVVVQHTKLSAPHWQPILYLTAQIPRAGEQKKNCFIPNLFAIAVFPPPLLCARDWTLLLHSLLWRQKEMQSGKWEDMISPIPQTLSKGSGLEGEALFSLERFPNYCRLGFLESCCSLYRWALFMLQRTSKEHCVPFGCSSVWVWI